MIVPTVGRVVWYFPQGVDGPKFAALVAYVHSDKMINIAFFDSNGVAGSNTSVRLNQDDEPGGDAPFCCWMPYQKSVAKGDIPPTLHAVPA